MDIVSTYSIKIKEYNHLFKESIKQYRSAVKFFVDVCLREWNEISQISSPQCRNSYVESKTIITKKRKVVLYSFNNICYKMPVYLRRAAISEALGKVSSYKSNLSNWEHEDKRIRGKRPTLTKIGNIYPALYKPNMFLRIDDYTAKIKVYRNNTWDWIRVRLRKSDVDYIKRHCSNLKECSPTLQKRGKQWYLDFAFKQTVKLNSTPIREQTILAVDLGLNSCATCSIMRSDGTVLGRKFLHLPKEYDSLRRKIEHIKKAQKCGSRNVSNLWAYAKGVNDDIAVKTARFIIDNAILYNVDCIVFEHLDLGGKKRGSHKQRLSLWKARYVQQMVEHKAHANGIRISTINAWGTSRLAYDGSGKVLRGQESERCNSYSECEFQTGKIYNCDLNATYNIGSRYFVREILKTLPARVRQHAEVNIHGCAKRSTCTLATLISLNGVLQTAV